MKKPSKHTGSGNAFTLKASSRRRVDSARKNTVLPNPLIAYLEDLDATDSRLARVAHQKSKESFDLKSLRADLLDRLRRVYYSQPRDPNRRKRTFYDRLKSKGQLSVFLRTSTLYKIRNWLLLRDIIRTDRELENKKLSIEYYPLRFHSFVTSELSRHERAVMAGISKYKVDERWLKEYLSAVNHEKLRQLRLLSLSRWPGVRGALLIGYRDENLAAEIGIFTLLKRSFENALPGRFLRRLTQLVCANSDVEKIDYNRDEALRVALTRRK